MLTIDHQQLTELSHHFFKSSTSICARLPNKLEAAPALVQPPAAHRGSVHRWVLCRENGNCCHPQRRKAQQEQRLEPPFSQDIHGNSARSGEQEHSTRWVNHRCINNRHPVTAGPRDICNLAGACTLGHRCQ